MYRLFLWKCWMLRHENALDGIQIDFPRNCLYGSELFKLPSFSLYNSWDTDCIGVPLSLRIFAFCTRLTLTDSCLKQFSISTLKCRFSPGRKSFLCRTAVAAMQPLISRKFFTYTSSFSAIKFGPRNSLRFSQGAAGRLRGLRFMWSSIFPLSLSTIVASQ